jgi:ATP-dependent RNA helicase DeaD
MGFETIGLKPELVKAVGDLGFENMMPVQAEAIPLLLEKDCDLIALAQTGTGKTAAFGLPLIQKLDLTNKNTEGLIICPTRELCIQIANDLKKYSKYLEACEVIPVYGGASIEMQIRNLKKGAKIIVATPGRMNDLIQRGKVKLSSVRYVVLDEADEMLNMGFKEDLDAILDQTPASRNTWLFSATMPNEVEEIANNYQDSPERIQIGSRNQGSNNVRHFYYLVHAKDRYLALKRIADYYPDIYAIIFCRTKVETQEVADMLIRDGYNADSLHGDLSQAQRDHVMSRFRLRNIQMLVATDVAARGLDVSNLTHVINYNLPDELEQYVHRSGRTGRADKQGISIAILNLKEKYKIKNIEKLIKKTFEKAEIPTGKQVCRKQLFNMINKVEQTVVDEEEIGDFLPEIVAKLSWLDREELIKKFVSLEFNRFLDYYKGAPDLNVDDTKPEKKDKKTIEKKSLKKGKGEFTRMFISLGRRDKIVPQRIIAMINDAMPQERVEIGKIDIMDNFSYIEVGSAWVEDLMFGMEDKFVKGRQIVFEPAEAKRKKSDDRERRGRNASKNKNSGFKNKNNESKKEKSKTKKR